LWNPALLGKYQENGRRKHKSLWTKIKAAGEGGVGEERLVAEEMGGEGRLACGCSDP